jgi:hypothetical protein
VRDAPSEPADASLHPSTHRIRRAELLLQHGTIAAAAAAAAARWPT